MFRTVTCEKKKKKEVKTHIQNYCGTREYWEVWKFSALVFDESELCKPCILCNLNRYSILNVLIFFAEVVGFHIILGSKKYGK